MAFLEVAQMTEGLLDDWNLEGDLQIAHFHPKFEFDGSGDGIDNYTNRCVQIFFCQYSLGVLCTIVCGHQANCFASRETIGRPILYYTFSEKAR